MSEKNEKKQFQAPKGFTAQAIDAIGYWADNGEEAILFVPRGVKLFDGSKKTDTKKPSCLLIGELKNKVSLISKDDEFDGQPGDTIGVFWKPGMGKSVVHAVGLETWIAPLFNEDGERKEIDTGKANGMKAYEVKFGGKLDTKARLPILEDARKESRYAKTVFDDPTLTPVRRRPETSPEAPTEVGDDGDVPF